MPINNTDEGVHPLTMTSTHDGGDVHTKAKPAALKECTSSLDAAGFGCFFFVLLSLLQGTTAIFDNHRVMHGRAAFKGKTRSM